VGKSSRVLVFLLILVPSLIASILLTALWGDRRFINQPLHAMGAVFGAMSALVMAIILRVEQREPRKEKLSLLSLGFLNMGILQAFHAGAPVGGGFILLHSLSYFVGAFCCALVWLPKYDSFAVKRGWLLWMTAAGSTAVGMSAIFFRAYFPAMTRNGDFTPLAFSLNIIAGFLFIAAMAYFLLDSFQFNSQDSFLFACLFVLFGLAEATFPFSALWNYTWWFWHLQQLVAYVLVLYYLIHHFGDAKASLRAANAMLEQRVAQRTAELSMEMNERRVAEQALRNVTSNLGEGIYVYQENGAITFMNPTAERLLGWSAEELNEKGAHNLIHGHRADGTPLPAEECGMLRVIKSGKLYHSRDEVMMRRDGTVFPVSVVSTPIMENGKVTGSVTAFCDITDERKLEAELLKLQKLESVGVLAGGIAHDYNNLLQAIMGNISLARIYLDQHSPGKALALLQEAEAASESAKDLSFRLLTFSRGADPIRKVSAVSDLIEKSTRLSLSGSNLLCDAVLPVDLRPVYVDEGQMTQVFNNILVNAREAMPQGGAIAIRAENVAIGAGDPLPIQAGDYVKISIRDSGPGIPEELQSRIFDPYFTTKEMGSIKGTGLGLAICMSIINKHHGHIGIESRKGAGTTIYLYLPAASSDDGVSQNAHAGIPENSLLFMDDDEKIRSVFGRMASQLGYAVEYASNGNEAIVLYSEASKAGRTFYGVILDLTVQGGMGGVEAVKKLLELDPGVKAIISSGYAHDPVIDQYPEYGFVAAITKPFNMDQLKTLLDKLARIPSQVS
jgi:PAS domain S-box-containing protein